MSANGPAPRAAPVAASAVWLERQLTESWRREGEPAEPGFEIGRPVVALTGLAILVLLAAETLSGLLLDQLWWLHLAAGLILLPALVLKLGPIGLRAGQYYWSRTVAWLRGGAASGRITPPVVVARLVAPLLVADTGLLLASGLVMWRLDNSGGVWSTVHNASAIVVAALVAIHLAFHVRASAAAVIPGMRAVEARDRGPVLVPTLVAASIIVGVVIAVFAVPASRFPQRPQRFGERQPAGAHVGYAASDQAGSSSGTCTSDSRLAGRCP